MEQTLVLIKPDAIQRGLTGRIIARLEDKGLKLVGMKMMLMDEQLAYRHYEAHVRKGFFPGLVKFITSSPIVAIVVRGEGAVEVVRKVMGATDPIQADLGTVRGDFGMAIGLNLIHGSDSPEAAIREIELFFGDQESLDYSRSIEPWITES